MMRNSPRYVSLCVSVESSAVQTLKVSAVSTSAAVISWNSVPGATGYRLAWGPTQGDLLFTQLWNVVLLETSRNFASFNFYTFLRKATKPGDVLSSVGYRILPLCVPMLSSSDSLTLTRAFEMPLLLHWSHPTCQSACRMWQVARGLSLMKYKMLGGKRGCCFPEKWSADAEPE